MIPITKDLVKKILKPRNPDSHKGDYGHALLIAGSEGKYGAAVLASKACVRSGVGLLTVHIPFGAEKIIQSTIPEAMVELDESEHILSKVPSELLMYSTIGIGPGLGTALITQSTILDILKAFQKPMVIDADALNILALRKEWLALLPPNSILTPHPKEFERLAGDWNGEKEQLEKLIHFSKEHSCFVLLKGHETKVACPSGELYVNSTGNAGMAKGGSGDVLTGIITAFLAQGYSALDAALLGVYIHGDAGDIAAERTSEISMLPSDLIEMLPESFRRLL